MTLELADGRGALWQWDTGRRLRVGSGVEQIHYQNRALGSSVDIDVGADGTAIIPDELLQDCHTLTAYAYVTDDTGAYTMVQQDFAVHKRAKPAGYVYAPTDQMTLQTIQRQIGDLSALQTDAKDNLVVAINEAAESGGSSDAVLYTPQVLTDAQKKRARENVDAASSDFVITAIPYPSREVTLDKTYEQIQEAIGAGKTAVMRADFGDYRTYLQLLFTSAAESVFAGLGYAQGGRRVEVRLVAITVSATSSEVATNVLVALNNGRALPQQTMASSPTSDMQIATKKYVDDKECILQSTTPNSNKKFKITVDDSGVLSAVEITE